MRFGRKLPWHQVPKWADSYIQYDEWKFLAKAGKIEELNKALARDSLLAETFLEKAHETVAQQLSILNANYGIALDSWPPKELHSIPSYEIEDITATLLEICSIVVPLSDYVAATQQAVERIDSKSSESLYEVEKLRKVLQTAATRWVKDLRGINAIVQNLRDTESNGKASISLLLSNLHPGGNLHTLKEAVEALQENSASRLEKCFHDAPICADTLRTQTDLLVLTRIAILCSAQRCLPFLLGRLSLAQSLREHPSQNPLRLCVLQAERLRKKGLAQCISWESINLVLNNLQPRERLTALLCQDGLGRLPLHYAAEYGLAAVCKGILDQIDVLQDSAAKGQSLGFLVPDHLGETPLLAAVIHGKADTIELLLQRLSVAHTKTSQPDVNEMRQIFRSLVSVAIRSQRTSITQTIIEYMPKLLSDSSEVQELLCLASQYGQASVVAKLCTFTSNINIGEKTRGRTPLMFASIYNYTDVMEILLAHPSCDINVHDHSGWSALDHAAFKGFPPLVKTLQSQRGEARPVEGAHVMFERDVKYKRQTDRATKHMRKPNHAYMTMKDDPNVEERSHIFVNIGHFDMDKEPAILQVDPFRKHVAPAQIPEGSLALQITGIDCDAPVEYWVSFPVIEDLANDPFYFSAQDPDAAKLRFRLFCSVVGQDNNAQKMSPIGSAIVSLSDARHGLGTAVESLMRDHTVSLVSSDATGSEYVGRLTFTFVMSKPFSFKGPAPTPSEIVLRRENSTLIAAHRGLGQNKPKRTRLQLGENTLDSFYASLDLGADQLEFGKRDVSKSKYVQVTRDLIPVVYHDFLLSEVGTDAPMHTVTYEQFMAPSLLQDPLFRSGRQPDSLTQPVEPRNAEKPRANSVGEAPLDNVDWMTRLRSTFNLQNFGYKGNVGCECISGPFMTLQELLVKIDESICFDIELKYPMLFEARDFNMDTHAMELNLFIDAMLAVVYKYAGSRPIWFSTFSPELCILLSTKQHLYPVLFLTESGNILTRDIRAISYQEAVRFAKKWNLKGVVPASEPLVASPMLIDQARDSGLICATWGSLNDDTECAQLQHSAQLDVIITNRVGEIAKTLKV